MAAWTWMLESGACRFMVINAVFDEYPDVYRPDIMVMLMFSEIYTITNKQRTYLKATAKPVSTEHVISAFKFAVGIVEEEFERPLENDERYHFVFSLWRRLHRLFEQCYIEIADPKAMQTLLTQWLCYEQSFMNR